MPDNRPRVGLVGHCLPDAYALQSAVGRALPGAEFVNIGDESTLSRDGGGYDLLLINRSLDGDFPDEDGIAMIARLKGESGTGKSPVLMLISNFPEAQVGAVAAGAAPGFGKSEMNTERAGERLWAALVRGGLSA